MLLNFKKLILIRHAQTVELLLFLLLQPKFLWPKNECVYLLVTNPAFRICILVQNLPLARPRDLLFVPKFPSENKFIRVRALWHPLVARRYFAFDHMSQVHSFRKPTAHKRLIFQSKLLSFFFVTWLWIRLAIKYRFTMSLRWKQSILKFENAQGLRLHASAIITKNNIEINFRLLLLGLHLRPQAQSPDDKPVTDWIYVAWKM